MREILILSGAACRGKSQTDAQQKGPVFPPCLWMEVGAFLHFRRQRKCNTFGRAGDGNRRGSNGNRLFPWHTILLARSSVLYLLRPWVPEGVPLADCGIAFGTAGSGRDRPANRQRPAAVRKRTEQKLRAVISEKISFRPGRRMVYKKLSSPPQRTNAFLDQN